MNTSANLPTVDSWESRISQAANVLGITAEEVEQVLLQDSIGIEKGPIGVEMLSDESVFRFADFSAVVGPSGKGVKMGKVRMAYQILLGSKNTERVKATNMDPRMVMLKERFGIRGSMIMVPTTELLQMYDPSLPNDPVTKELKDRLKDKKVVLFRPDTEEVAVKETCELIIDDETGHDLPGQAFVDGVLVRTYAIGEVPDRIYEMDPLIPNAILRRGYSDVTRVDWTNISYELRQFCVLCVEMGLVKTSDRRDVIGLIDLVKKGRKALAEAYPDVDLLFREQEKDGSLPNLRIRKPNGTGAKTSNNPFGIGKNQKW